MVVVVGVYVCVGFESKNLTNVRAVRDKNRGCGVLYVVNHGSACVRVVRTKHGTRKSCECVRACVRGSWWKKFVVELGGSLRACVRAVLLGSGVFWYFGRVKESSNAYNSINPSEGNSSRRSSQSVNQVSRGIIRTCGCLCWNGVSKKAKDGQRKRRKSGSTSLDCQAKQQTGVLSSSSSSSSRD